MPHKRAKRSVREQQRSEKGTDLAPSKQALSNEAIPKSLSRVLNAAKVREEWRTRKRKSEGADTEEKNAAKKQKLNAKISGIQPGESLQHYNKRVENDMRPLVRSAVQSSNAVVRSTRQKEIAGKKEKLKSDATVNDHTPQLQPSKPIDFESISSSAPKRLNDIAQAPPEIGRLPRGAKASAQKRDGVLSLAQKTMMEQEREKAITRYRQLKASRRKDRNGDEVGQGDED